MCRRALNPRTGNQLCALLLAFAMAKLDGLAYAQYPGGRSIPHNGWISLTLAAPLASATAKVKDPLTVTLNQTLTLEGKPVVPAGTKLKAHVTRVRHPGTSCVQGYVFWELDDFPVPSYGVEVFHELRPKDRDNIPAAVVALDPADNTKQKSKGGVGHFLMKPVEGVAVIAAIPLVIATVAVASQQDSQRYCSGKGHEMALPSGTKFLALVSEKIPPNSTPSSPTAAAPPSDGTEVKQLEPKAPNDSADRSPDSYGVPYNCR